MPVANNNEEQRDVFFRQLINLEFEIEQDIDELRQFAGPLTTMQQASTQIKSKLNKLHKKIKNVEQFAEEQDSEVDKHDILDKLQRHTQQEDTLTQQLRQATLQYQVNVQRAHLQERKALLEGSDEALRRREIKSRKDMIDTTQQLTDSLHRIRNRMYQEAERSSVALSELERSSKVIDKTVNEQQNLSGSVRLGKSVLNRLKRRDFTDRLLILFGVFVFLLVVLYVVLDTIGVLQYVTG